MTFLAPLRPQSTLVDPRISATCTPELERLQDSAVELASKLATATRLTGSRHLARATAYARFAASLVYEARRQPSGVR